MTVTPEELIAYADGELDGAEKARVELAIAANAALQAHVAQHRAMRDRLSAAYADVLDESVPARLVNAARAKPLVDNVLPIGVKRAGGRPATWGVREWSAMAAALLVGVIIGGDALRPGRDLVAVGGRLEARRALARALDTQLASDQGEVRIGVSFRNTAGDICRTFSASGGALNGLACHDSGSWRVDMALTAPPRADTEFRTASVETPTEILARVDASIVGEPFDSAHEKDARHRRWTER